MTTIGQERKWGFITLYSGFVALLAGQPILWHFIRYKLQATIHGWLMLDPMYEIMDKSEEALYYMAGDWLFSFAVAIAAVITSAYWLICFKHPQWWRVDTEIAGRRKIQGIILILAICLSTVWILIPKPSSFETTGALEYAIPFSRTEYEECLEDLKSGDKKMFTTKVAGINTGAGSVMLVELVKLQDDGLALVRSAIAEEPFLLEQGMLKPILKAKDQKFDITGKYLIFPCWSDSESIAEADMETYFPRTFDYLKKHRQILEARKNISNWYGRSGHMPTKAWNLRKWIVAT